MIDSPARLSVLSRLSYRPGVVRLVHRLGLRRALSHAYYSWKRPPRGIVRVRVANVSGAFHVRSAWQLRWLESLAVDSRMDPDLDALLSTLRPGDVAYDVGANIGVFSVLMAGAVGGNGQVVSFEPQRSVFEHLLANVRLNRRSNVSAFCAALSDAVGSASISAANESVLSSLESSGQANVSKEQVRTEVGDRFRALHRLPVPRAVKIDVEGHEHAVIQGLRETLVQPECGLVCCEIHPQLLPRGVTEETVLTLLRDLGFGNIRLHRFPTWSVAVCRKDRT